MVRKKVFSGRFLAAMDALEIKNKSWADDMLAALKPEKTWRRVITYDQKSIYVVNV